MRVQAELWAASLSDPELRAKFVPRSRPGSRSYSARCATRSRTLQAHGVVLPPPFTAEVIATWISEFWLGMEFADLIGAREERRPHRAALDAMEELLRASARASRSPRPAQEVIMQAALPDSFRKVVGELPAPVLPERAGYPFETMRPVRDGFVERDGVKTWYAQFGDSGPWLAFAPIFQIANATCCKGVVPYLSQHFRVVVDGPARQRPLRPADRPEQYTFDHYYARLRRGAGRGWTSTASRVVGISATAMTALRLAAEQPQRVSHLVIVGGLVERRLDEPEAAERSARQSCSACAPTGRPTSTTSSRIVFTEPHSTKPYEDGVRDGWATDGETVAMGLARLVRHRRARARAARALPDAGDPWRRGRARAVCQRPGDRARSSRARGC